MGKVDLRLHFDLEGCYLHDGLGKQRSLHNSFLFVHVGFLICYRAGSMNRRNSV